MRAYPRQRTSPPGARDATGTDGTRRCRLARQLCFATGEQTEMMMDKTAEKGKANEVAGKTKAIAGKAPGNDNLEAKGQSQAAKGKMQSAPGFVALRTFPVIRRTPRWHRLVWMSDYSLTEDADLVFAIGAGQDAALSVLYDRLHRQCFAFSVRISVPRATRKRRSRRRSCVCGEAPGNTTARRLALAAGCFRSRVTSAGTNCGGGAGEYLSYPRWMTPWTLRTRSEQT